MPSYLWFRKNIWRQYGGQAGKRSRLEAEKPVRKLSQWPRQLTMRIRIASERGDQV